MNPWVKLLVIVVLLAVSVFGGWFLTSAVLRLAGRSPDAGAPSAGRPGNAPTDRSRLDVVHPDSDPQPATPGTESDGPDGSRARAVLRGGTWIGILERLAVTGGVLAGDLTLLAVVVAIKGLGRYPELRENPGASERFVIGTLASMTWAAAIGAVGVQLLH